MNDKVLSIKQMQELIELGIDTSKASMHWSYVDFYDSHLKPFWSLQIGYRENDKTNIPTFTLQDILEMLPDITVDDITYGLFLSHTSCRYEHLNGTHFIKGNSVDIFKEFAGSNSLEAAFNMLKWCKQNNYI